MVLHESEVQPMKLLQYLFLEDSYIVGCRRIADDAELPSVESKKRYHYLFPTINCWYADPFLYEKGGRVYVFVEAYNLWFAKGSIGVAIFEKGKFSRVKLVLEKDFHMSYPNVFEIDGNIYMIPETCARRQIQLYEATEFPYKWSLKKVLVDDIDAVDTSIFMAHNGSLFLYTKENRDGGQLLWFELGEDFSVRPVDVPGMAQERPGGNPLYINNGILRPLQDGKACYGHRVLLYQSENENNSGDGKETLAQIVDTDCFFNLPQRRYKKTHTLNRSENYEVIDAHGDFIDVIKPLRKIFRKIRKTINWSFR